MFGSIDKSTGLLFVTYDLGQSLQNRQQKMRDEIEGLDGNRLLNTPVTDLVTYFVERHEVEPITFLKESWYADTKEVQVDVRHDPMRWIDDKSKPALVADERTEVRIPFEDESELFYSRSNTYRRGSEALSVYSSPCHVIRTPQVLVRRQLLHHGQPALRRDTPIS